MDLPPQTVMTSERRVGTLLKGKWHIDAILGVGGMATVYAATHRNKKRVAIKMLHPEVSLNHDISSRFLREGYVANTVDHQGTVAVLDDDVTEDGAAFLVMELLEGETLETRQERKGGKLPISEVLWVAERLLDVLAAAHEKGIVHRDIKPDNLFITTNNQLKVLDFGIARMQDLSASASATLGTKMGSLLGTPGFMAPEQARGRTEQIDARTDIWSVGATLFRLLTSRPVHEAETLNEQLIYAATTPAISLATTGDFPPALVNLIDRALAFEKTDRWPSAAAMLSAVRSVIEGDPAISAISSVIPQHGASLASNLAPNGTARLVAPPYTPTVALAEQPAASSASPSFPPAALSSPSSEPRLSTSPASTPPSSSIPPLNAPEEIEATKTPRRRGVFVVLAAVASAATLGLVLLSQSPAATQPANAETSAPSQPAVAPPTPSASVASGKLPSPEVSSAAPSEASAVPPTPAGPPSSSSKKPKTSPPSTATPTATPPHTTTAPPATTKPPTPPPTTTVTATPPNTAKPNANPFDRRF